MNPDKQSKDNRVLEKKKNLAIYIERMKGVSPLDKLNQGYSFLENIEGKSISDISHVKSNDKLSIYVKNGKIFATVTGKEDVKWVKQKRN